MGYAGQLELSSVNDPQFRERFLKKIGLMVSDDGQLQSPLGPMFGVATIHKQSRWPNIRVQ